jgi:hypothetical protein
MFEDIFEKVCKTLTKTRKVTWRLASNGTLRKQFKTLKGGSFVSSISLIRFLDAANTA